MFGQAVALSEDTVVTGAPDADVLALDAGAAMVFDPRGGDGGAAGWWNGGSLALTPVAPESLSRSNVVFRFVGWDLDGVRQSDGQGSPVNPLTNILMNFPHRALAVYLPESEDTDADSLPDWWERRYLNTLAQNASSDADGDGHSCFQEWLAGTIPSNPTSVLRMSGQLLRQSQTNAFVLRWPSVGGKVYRVYTAPECSGSYSCILSNLVATPPMNQITLPLLPGAAFFKVQPEVDLDGDSLPDSWEQQYFGNLTRNPAQDSDGDGHSNGQEWHAGTNPSDPASVLQVKGLMQQQNQTNSFVLQWTSVPGKSYRIHQALDCSGSYSCVASNIVATPPLNQVYLPAQPAAAFYKVQLE